MQINPPLNLRMVGIVKKALFLVLAVLLCLSIAGCSSGSPVPPAASAAPANASSPSSGQFDEATALAQLDIKDYQYYRAGAFSSDMILVIKNNSPYSLNLKLYGTFYDDKDKKLGEAVPQNANALDPGRSMAYVFSYLIDADGPNFSRFESNISAEENIYLKSASSWLDVKTETAGNIVTTTITNTNDKTAHWIVPVVLLLKDGQIVGMSYSTLAGELQPGESKYRETYSRDPFDSVEVYVSAMAD